MNTLDKKQILINDIQNLLNSYDDVATTKIDPKLLEFMDTPTLINIIDSLLSQKENLNVDIDWLKKFKTKE